MGDFYSLGLQVFHTGNLPLLCNILIGSEENFVNSFAAVNL